MGLTTPKPLTWSHFRSVARTPLPPGIRGSEAGGDGVDLIAEPWTIELGTYQLGEFPSRWAEWNDKYRDTIRRLRTGSASRTFRQVSWRDGCLAQRTSFRMTAASRGIRQISSLRTTAFRCAICIHSTRRGTISRGRSARPKVAPTTTFHGIRAAILPQRQAARTGLALLMVSAGVPMITGGDEMYRTPFGNNNRYNVDSEKNYLKGAHPA